MASWSVDRSRVLARSEIQAVLEDLGRRARRSRLTRRNLILFRLATCCGLRVGELTQLRLGDLHLGLQPFLVVRSETTKADSKGRRRRRTVPLWWDAGTLQDLTAWVALRRASGSGDEDYVVSTRFGGRIDCAAARRTFQSACRILRRHVTIHDGRHSFASHSIAGGRTLVEVRDAMGHRSLATTSIYAHLVGDDAGRVGSLFGPQNMQRESPRDKTLFASQCVAALARPPRDVGCYMGAFQFAVSY